MTATYYSACKFLLGNKDPTIMICGGGEGLTTDRFLTQFPNATIYIIEPTPISASRLINKYKSNPRIKVEQLAIGATNGTVQLEVRDLVLGSGLYKPSEYFKHSHKEKSRMVGAIEVPCVTIPHYIKNFTKLRRINIVELVIEGSEFAALQGCIGFFRDIDIIIVYVIVTPLYENNIYFWHIDNIMCINSFGLYNIFQLTSDGNGRLVRAHVLYANDYILKRLGK